MFEVAVVGALVLIGVFTAYMQDSVAVAVPVLGMFGAVAMRLLPAVTALLNSTNEMHASRGVLADLASDLRHTPTHTDAPNKHVLKPICVPIQSIQITQVSFTYPGTSTANLTDVSLALPVGAAIAVSARSGVGKSTLADLMLGFHSPTAGSIEANGGDIAEDPCGWLDLVTYIPQDVYRLDGTLRANIEFGSSTDETDEVLLHDALRLAQLSELVDSLPDGLQAWVGEDDIRLSGGQCQRVALARALFHDRQFIVFDEATSALDIATEDAIVEAVLGLVGAKTVVIIAHRESNLARCAFRLNVADCRVALSTAN